MQNEPKSVALGRKPKISLHLWKMCEEQLPCKAPHCAAKRRIALQSAAVRCIEPLICKTNPTAKAAGLGELDSRLGLPQTRVPAASQKTCLLNHEPHPYGKLRP